MPLVHVTSAKNLGEIAQSGLRTRSYFIDPAHDSGESLIDYYAETIQDEGDEPVVLLVPEDAFDPALFEADLPGIEEPITVALGMSEGDVFEEWEASDKTAEDSRRIIGSFRYAGTIQPESIQIAQDGYEVGEPLTLKRPVAVKEQSAPVSAPSLAAGP